MNSKDLWMLSQRRHLIVHNRGVVDHRYNKQTGETYKEGQRLYVPPTDIELYVTLVRDIGIAILEAADNELSHDSGP